MKIKNFLFIILPFLFITYAINAAELTIYNKQPRQISVKVVWLSWQNKEVFKNYLIAPDNYIHVSTGGPYPFRRLLWIEGRGPIGYAINIPSSRMMLNGQIQIGTDGQYSINFNQNGVSERKFTVNVALPAIKSAEMEESIE